MTTNNKDPKAQIDGIFSGISGILNKLTDLAKHAEETVAAGQEFSSKDGKIKSSFNFKVKTGINDDKEDVSVEPVAKAEKQNTADVKEILEPNTDIFEEDGFTLVVVELPGVELADAEISVNGDVLTISAQRNLKKYYKEILLPRSYEASQVNISSCNNGILEIKCKNK